MGCELQSAQAASGPLATLPCFVLVGAGRRPGVWTAGFREGWKACLSSPVTSGKATLWDPFPSQPHGRIQCWVSLPLTRHCQRKKLRKESRVQSRVRKTSGGGNGSPLQFSCLETPMDRAAWRAAVHGVSEGLGVTQRLSAAQQSRSSHCRA